MSNYIDVDGDIKAGRYEPFKIKVSYKTTVDNPKTSKRNNPSSKKPVRK